MDKKIGNDPALVGSGHCRGHSHTYRYLKVRQLKKYSRHRDDKTVSQRNMLHIWDKINVPQIRHLNLASCLQTRHCGERRCWAIIRLDYYDHHRRSWMGRGKIPGTGGLDWKKKRKGDPELSPNLSRTF